MTWEWTPVEGDGWTARGTHWIWEVVPYLPDKNWPDRKDSWILRGRSPHRTDWKYFGAYKGFSNAIENARVEDQCDVNSSLFRRYYPGERRSDEQ
jgi:hypothetical protein